MTPLSGKYFFLTGYRLFMVMVVTIAVVELFLILWRTRLDIRIRAGTLDLETVSVLGVNVRRTFQITEVFPELSVLENLRVAVEVAPGYRLSPWLSRSADGEIRARVTELLDMGGLADKADRLVDELAHGDQRATGIMMSIALKPQLQCSMNRPPAWAIRRPTTSPA